MMMMAIGRESEAGRLRSFLAFLICLTHQIKCGDYLIISLWCFVYCSLSHFSFSFPFCTLNSHWSLYATVVHKIQFIGHYNLKVLRIKSHFRKHIFFAKPSSLVYNFNQEKPKTRIFSIKTTLNFMKQHEKWYFIHFRNSVLFVETSLWHSFT